MEKWEVVAVETEVSPELQPLRTIVEQEISRRYGYRRIDPSLLDIELEGLFIEGAYVETRPTLMDALFSAYKALTAEKLRERAARSEINHLQGQ